MDTNRAQANRIISFPELFYNMKDQKQVPSEEKLKYYSLDGKLLGVEEKAKLHQKMRGEWQKSKKVTIKHKHVRMLLMTTKGKILLQMRSKWKADNPGVWDKTIGGHVTAEDDYDLTVMKECAEELGIPATIVQKADFERAAKTTNTNILAILKQVEVNENYVSTRRAKEGFEWKEPNMSAFYLGYYDGPIWFVDSESSGIQIFEIDELKRQMKEKPKEFSEDIKYMFTKWESEIRPVSKEKHVLND